MRQAFMVLSLVLLGCQGTPSPRYQGPEATPDAQGDLSTDGPWPEDGEGPACLDMNGKWGLKGEDQDGCLPANEFNVTLTQELCHFSLVEGTGGLASLESLEGDVTEGEMAFVLVLHESLSQERISLDCQGYLEETEASRPLFKGYCEPDNCRWTLRFINE